MKKQIGEVGVDSGQILICDPCYIDSQWKHEEFNIKSRYQHTDGTILTHTFNSDGGITNPEINFSRYDNIIPKYGKCMNDMIEQKEVVKLPDADQPSKFPFSYNACCKKTCGNSENGQLNYEMGHPGVGVVASSGYGDGSYPVIADIDDKTGRVKSITVVFIDDDEEDPFDDSEERRDFGNDHNE
jgi:hypothetical protein